jgi:RNA polymerase sigma factor (sigma-70 family)
MTDFAMQFEQERPHLARVAYRMLGSVAEAEDAVQEAWLRLSRSDAAAVDNLGGWLTTVVARVCLDVLRTRRSRGEQLAGNWLPEPVVVIDDGPEEQALLADSVALALLVVLETLTPAERLAFVLHDIYAVPFDEIAPIVERSQTAARQLASRARRRVRGAETTQPADRARQRAVVDAFLAASHSGNFAALLTMLDPEVVFRIDGAASPKGVARAVRGAPAVARQFSGRAQGARRALVDGAVAAIVAPLGHLFLVLNFTIRNDKIVEIEAVADPARLRQLHLAVLDD